MAAFADRLLAILKWPSALLSLLLLPGAAWAFADLVPLASDAPQRVWPLIGGACGYWLLWLMFFRRPGFGSLLSTFEHELTHAVFAWATFHRVTGLKATWKDGGAVTIRGKGNWLILVAPYFFPTVTVIAVLALIWVPVEYLSIAAAIVGVTVAYHITSTWKETHPGQTDLQKAGYVFSVLWLPAANVVSYGAVLAFALAGAAGVGTYAEGIAERTAEIAQEIGAWIQD